MKRQLSRGLLRLRGQPDATGSDQSGGSPRFGVPVDEVSGPTPSVVASESPPRILVAARPQILASVFQRALTCHLCPRFEDKRAVVGPQNGAPNSPVMFVAEAPGRHGADRSGIPLHGDA